MQFLDFIKGDIVTTPEGDFGETAAVFPRMGEKVEIAPSPDLQIIYGWQCETAMARIRLDLWNVSSGIPVTIPFQILSCSTCDTDSGIVVASRTLTIPVKTPGRNFALGVWGGVPGPYWCVLARVSVGNVRIKCAFSAWFDRLGDGLEKLGPEVT